MKILSRFKQNRTETQLLVEQNRYFAQFCNYAQNVTLGTTQSIIDGLCKADKKSLDVYTNCGLHSEIIKDKGIIIVSAFSCGLFILIQQLYLYPVFHVYLIKDTHEDLPFFKQLCQLKRVTLISHKEALSSDICHKNQVPIFISIPEFHPKSLSSEHKISLYNHPCLFSSYPWLLKYKQNLPIHYLDVNNVLVNGNFPKSTYDGLAQCYQSTYLNIYSWSRLLTHKEVELSQRLIAQTNQLEALLRYMHPRLSDIDLQPTLEAIRENKLSLISGKVA